MSLKQFILINANKDEIDEATCRKKPMENFEYVLQIVVLVKVYTEIIIASQYL